MIISCYRRSLPSVWSEEQEPPVPPIPGIGEGPVILTTTSASTPVSHRESWVACGVSCRDVDVVVVVVVVAVVAVVVIVVIVVIVVHACPQKAILFGGHLRRQMRNNIENSKTSLPKNPVQVRISFPERDISSFNLQVIFCELWLSKFPRQHFYHHAPFMVFENWLGTRATLRRAAGTATCAPLVQSASQKTPCWLVVVHMAGYEP